jgi:GH25 family lysozyme M1 (1,4-beta-N-acetylmuramidase)
MLAGIDVSGAWNGTVDWSRVHGAGVRFAFAKCSEGVSYADPSFPGHFSDMRAAGVVRGAYHYARPQADRSGSEEADHMLGLMRAAGWNAQDLPPAVGLQWDDCPLGPDDLHTWFADFVATVEHALGRKPIVCTGGFWTHRLAARSPLGCSLWLADDRFRARLPAAWPGWTFWQRTRTARVGGINGSVNLDFYAGSAEQLLALGTDGDAVRAAEEPQIPSRAGYGPAPVVPYPGFSLRAGIAGPEVRMWQNRMRSRRWTLAADGEFGPGCVAACEQFQRQHGLTVDGVVGPETWTAAFSSR